MHPKTTYPLSAAEMAVLDFYFKEYCTPPLRMAEAENAEKIVDPVYRIFEETRELQGRMYTEILSQGLPAELNNRIVAYAFNSSDLSPEADSQCSLMIGILSNSYYLLTPTASRPSPFSAIMSPVANLRLPPRSLDKEPMKHYYSTLSAAQIYLLHKAIESTPIADQAALVNQLFDQLMTMEHSTLEVFNYFISTALLSPEHLNQRLLSYVSLEPDMPRIMFESPYLKHETPLGEEERTLFKFFPNLLHKGASLPENPRLETVIIKLLKDAIERGRRVINDALEALLPRCMLTYILRHAGQGTFDMNRPDAEGDTLVDTLQIFNHSIPGEWRDRINPRIFTLYSEMFQILQNTGAPSDAAMLPEAVTSEARDGLISLIGPEAHEEIASYWQFLESQPQLTDRPELKILLLKLHLALAVRGEALDPAKTAFLEADSRGLAAVIPLLTSITEHKDHDAEVRRIGPS